MRELVGVVLKFLLRILVEGRAEVTRVSLCFQLDLGLVDQQHLRLRVLVLSEASRLLLLI